jgi:hypothetical protein
MGKKVSFKYTLEFRLEAVRLGKSCLGHSYIFAGFPKLVSVLR